MKLFIVLCFILESLTWKQTYSTYREAVLSANSLSTKGTVIRLYEADIENKTIREIEIPDLDKCLTPD